MTQKCVKLAPDGTKPGLFQIRFQYILSEKVRMSIWGLYDPLLAQFGHPGQLSHYHGPQTKQLSLRYRGVRVGPDMSQIVKSETF